MKTRVAQQALLIITEKNAPVKGRNGRRRDVQVAVAAAQSIEKGLGHLRVTQRDAVLQLVERAHVGGLDALERVRGGVGVKQIVKQSVVVEVFRDGDLQQTLIGAPRTEVQPRQQQEHRRDDDEKHRRERDIAHAGRKTERHGEEDYADLPRRAGHGAKAHEAERPGNGDARADVAVDEQDDDLHDRGQHRDRDGKALTALRAVHTEESRGDAEHERHRRADEESREHKPGCKDGIKHCKAPPLKTIRWEEYGPYSTRRTWKTTSGAHQYPSVRG